MKPDQLKRETLKTKMSQALNQEINALPSAMQKILIDDLVTAFENRFAVFNKSKTDFCSATLVELEISN
jgi:hypothetical protein